MFIRPRVFCTFGSSGLSDPSWKAAGFCTSRTCLRPSAASPALSKPGESFARGSLTSGPVIPAGNGSAFSGANGFAGVGEGEGEGVCAIVTTKQAHKNNEVSTTCGSRWVLNAVVNKRKIISRVRFIDWSFNCFVYFVNFVDKFLCWA